MKQLRFAEDFPEEYEDGRADIEVEAVTKMIDGGFDARQLCDIGPSNGVHTAQLLERLQRRAALPVRYLGLDFSDTLMRGARRRLTDLLPTDHTFRRWDMETGATAVIKRWRSGRNPVLICLFGNTLGNVLDEAATLRNIHLSSHPGDRLAVGVYLASEHCIDAASQYYTQRAILDMATEPLRAAGLNESTVRVDVRRTGNRITFTGTLLKPFSRAGIRLDAGHCFECFTSARYEEGRVRALLDHSGWRCLPDWSSHNDEYLVAVAERMPTTPS
ncbi:L-histidine N(alpha)-methyltransferase [Actinoplanes sp. NPDC049265]|uniref:L-histidine N(alpha)-methyltransferase n=1 Tax=Actinoplanes sp. NPDC049265 TaxID=3363902 RepID=UPI00371F2536